MLDQITASVGTVTDPSPGSDVEELQQLREELNWYYRRLSIEEEKGHPVSNANVQQLVQEIQMRELRFRRALRDTPSNSNLPLQSVTPFTLEDIQKAIPPRTAIIEYLTSLVIALTREKYSRERDGRPEGALARPSA